MLIYMKIQSGVQYIVVKFGCNINPQGRNKPRSERCSSVHQNYLVYTAVTFGIV